MKPIGEAYRSAAGLQAARRGPIILAMPPGRLPRDVKALGLVSLLNDASSEMIYPLLPSFLTSVLHTGPAFLGLLEGLAESLAAFVKLASGRISDRLPRRKPLVVAGYVLSSGARPWMALAVEPVHALVVRLLDRAGKGLRSAPRDALLASVTPAAERGRAFGFHRAMDHSGAVLGPLLAALALWATGDLRLTFALAALPGVLSVVALVFGVEEREETTPSAAPARAPLGRPLKLYLAVLAVFMLGNSSDAFLLLRAQEAGVELVAIPLLWAFHHVVKAALGTYGGGLSDRIGRRRAIALGFLAYALTYAGFALASAAWQIWLLFAAYGVYFALSEGAEKALLAELSPEAARGSAFGAYHATSGALLLPASALTGWLWQAYGSATALGLGAALALVSGALLLALVPEA